MEAREFGTYTMREKEVEPLTLKTEKGGAHRRNEV
jgi:hypothetical protein